MAISTCFHLHEHRAAVYGRADLYRPIGCFSVLPIRSSIPVMHVVRAVNRSINCMQY